MCTAATYKTKDFYFGRTLDYEFSYGDQITITPRNYPFSFRHAGTKQTHYAIIGMAHVAGDYPFCLLYTSPVKTFISVDFPAPFSPRSACTSPFSTVSCTFFSTGTPLKDLQMFFILSLIHIW